MSAGDCAGFLDQLFDANIEELNAKIIVCIFWRLLDAFISVAPAEFLLVGTFLPFNLFVS